MTKLENAAVQSNVPIWNVLNVPTQFNVNINSGAIKKLQGFASLINQFKQVSENEDAYDTANHIASTTGILKDLYNDQSPEGRSRYENIQELLNGIKDFVSSAFEEGNETKLQNYIENVSLLTDMDKKEDGNTDKVTLMTIHMAKGLEFPHLYLAGLEEGLFPSNMSIETPEDIEEERRLFYVALTRAEKTASIFWSQTRYKWGSAESKVPSRFIKELDEQYVDSTEANFMDEPLIEQGQSVFKRQSTKPSFSSRSSTQTIRSRQQRQPLKKAQPTVNPDFTPDPPEKIEKGHMVMHQRFGRGQITHIEGEGTNKKATVQFASGRKTLLLRFAKLKIINKD